MNITELADKISTEHNVGKAEAKRMVETVLSTIAHAAGQGEEVALGGFGRFKVAERPARPGRNPATGEAIQIAASRKLAFAPAKQLRDRLNGPAGETAKGDGKAKGETTKGGGKTKDTAPKGKVRARA